MEEQTITVPDYRAVSVYDVSQTDGKELPTTHVDVLDGDVEHFQDLQAALLDNVQYRAASSSGGRTGLRIIR